MCCVMGFMSGYFNEEQIRLYFDRTKSRGPDDTRIEKAGPGLLCFHRLSIMGLHESGMQPFSRGGNKVVCNGELYGWRKQRRALEAKGYSFAMPPLLDPRKTLSFPLRVTRAYPFSPL